MEDILNQDLMPDDIKLNMDLPGSAETSRYTALGIQNRDSESAEIRQTALNNSKDKLAHSFRDFTPILHLETE